MYSGSEDDEPDWVKTEKEQFAAYRDKDSDGFMDKNEVRDWILPNDYDHSEAESKHLMHEADDNKVLFIIHEYLFTFFVRDF